MFRPLALSLCLFCHQAASHASPLPDYPFVSASGSAEIWLAPDIGELQFDVVAQHRGAEQALAQMAEASAALNAMFGEGGVAAADIDAFDLAKKTVSLSEQASAEPDLAHIITRHYAVRVRNLAAWPGFVAALLERNSVERVGVAFDRLDRDQVNGRLVQEAAQNARHGAADLAQAFGRKPAAAVAISRTPLDKLGGAFGFAAAAAAAPRAAPPAPGVAGHAVPAAIRYAQTVHAVFKLK
jgi:uncharacterized protein YggE